MTDSKICMASADGHVGPPTAVYKDYLEKWLHPAFDDYYSAHRFRWASQSKDSYLPANFSAKFWDTEGFDPEQGTPVAWDASLRLKAMDQSMMACEIQFPDDQSKNDPPWGSGLASGSVEGSTGAGSHSPGLVRAGARAYNRWLADFCSADPGRLHGLTLVGTLDDIGWCVEEVRRAYESGLRTGMMLPLEYYLPLYHHPRYDILWETLSELNMPVVSHVSRGTPDYLGEDPWVQRFMYAQECGWYAQRPIWCLMAGGVLERFPNLRLGITELGVDWVAPLLRTLDERFDQWPEMQAPTNVHFSMKPTEYWKHQCFVAHTTCQFRHQFEGEAFDAVPNMVWGADLGHAEGWWPVFGFPDPVPVGHPGNLAKLPAPIPAEDTFKAIWNGLPASKMLPYFEDNFFWAYSNIDRRALDDVVQRIGPTPAEVGLVQ